MKDFRSFISLYYQPLLLGTLIILLMLFEPDSGRWFRFDRHAIADGQWWRLLTAHWVHLSWGHALGNLGGLALFSYIAGPALKGRLLLPYFFFCSFFVGFGLYLFASDLNYYVGLSGVLHGMLLVAVFVSPSYSRRIAWLFLLIIIGKVIWEQSGFYNDQALAGIIGGRVEVRAHLLGAVSAIVCLLILHAWPWPLNTRIQPDE